MAFEDTNWYRRATTRALRRIRARSASRANSTQVVYRGDCTKTGMRPDTAAYLRRCFSELAPSDFLESAITTRVRRLGLSADAATAGERRGPDERASAEKLDGITLGHGPDLASTARALADYAARAMVSALSMARTKSICRRARVHRPFTDQTLMPALHAMVGHFTAICKARTMPI